MMPSNPLIMAIDQITGITGIVSKSKEQTSNNFGSLLECK